MWILLLLVIILLLLLNPIESFSEQVYPIDEWDTIDLVIREHRGHTTVYSLHRNGIVCVNNRYCSKNVDSNLTKRVFEIVQSDQFKKFTNVGIKQHRCGNNNIIYFVYGNYKLDLNYAPNNLVTLFRQLLNKVSKFYELSLHPDARTTLVNYLTEKM